MAVISVIAACLAQSICLGNPNSFVIDSVDSPPEASAIGALPFIVSPSSNSIVDAGDIFIAAQTGDPQADIASIAFYEGERQIGQCLASPFSIIWSNVPPGHYTLTARASTDAGESATSAPVRIEARAPVAAALLRGPYLQAGTPHSVVVRWRTDQPTGSKVIYGRGGNLTQWVESAEQVVDHEIKLTNLRPDTRYYYGVGSPSRPLVSGFYYFFTTSPIMEKPTRIWVIGDSGTASADARRVWEAYETFTGGRLTDVWLMLGDNAYGSGTDTDYQRAVFDMYPGILRQNVVWPTLGNHDSSPAYYSLFTLPTRGEAGGVASGTEHYYSFDYGNIHFVCLDSSFSARGSNGVMCTWLRADLAANEKEWVIAFWHHPPYSKGSHNSDVEHELIQMRENVVPILEEYGVDLVLGGHSHCYERSFLLRGHYGFSPTLRPSMILDNGNGRSDETGAYVKASVGPGAHHGTVYVVAGSSGWATFGSLDHPAMYVSYLTMGSLVLDIEGPALNATFLTKDGTIDDYFHMVKESPGFRLTSLYLNGRQLALTFNSIPGKSYRIEFSPALSPPVWSPYSGPIGAFQLRTTWIDYLAPIGPAGFYRVGELP